MKDKIIAVIKKRKKLYVIITMVILLITIISLIVYIGLKVNNEKERVEATKRYNSAVSEYNEMVNQYINSLDNCMIDNISGFYIPEKLGLVSENSEDINATFENGNSIEKIEADIETINNMTKEIEDMNMVVAQIKQPSKDWVIERLEGIEEITDIGYVTDETDINAMLGKEGGYRDCIYFGVDSIDASTINGEDIVAKGTDAGGAIEVFTNIEDAEARCAYLEEYEGTLLYSGSYAIVGTMVIRTSYKLTGMEQLELTDRITMEFTKVY